MGYTHTVYDKAIIHPIHHPQPPPLLPVAAAGWVAICVNEELCNRSVWKCRGIKEKHQRGALFNFHKWNVSLLHLSVPPGSNGSNPVPQFLSRANDMLIKPNEESAAAPYLPLNNLNITVSIFITFKEMQPMLKEASNTFNITLFTNLQTNIIPIRYWHPILLESQIFYIIFILKYIM